MDVNPPQEFDERPWIVLQSTYDVEAWIEQFNWDLRRAAINPNANGYGICFRLVHGGEVYLHTTSDGDVLLDVTEDAEWVSPLIAAATQLEAPSSRIWQLPSDTLTQLIFAMNSLIASTRMVLQHDYKTRKRY